VATLSVVTRLLIVTVIPIGLLLASPSASSAAELELKFGNISAPNVSLFSGVAVSLARAIETESGGRIAVDARPMNGFGTPVEMLPKVESGEIDMTLTIAGYYPGRFPRTSVIELPTLFDSGESGTRILWKLFEEGLVAPEYKGLKVLGLFAGAPSAMLVIDKNVTRLGDLRGMRVRVSGATAGLAFARLGMIPLGLPGNLLVPSIAKDWVDMLSYSVDSAISTPSKPPRMVTDETPVLIDAKFGASSFMLVMNQQRFEALPRDLQAVIDRVTGIAFSASAAQLRDAGETTATRTLAADSKHRVFSFSEQDRAEIVERVAPVFDDSAADLKSQGIDGAALLQRARELAKGASS
jgi:TRAP-type C4-dicarboxylate transport system substrate-binding protein